MGAVYEAVHLNNGSRVAIKVLHPEYAANPDVKRRFQREGYLANKVSHPDVARVLDDGACEDGAPFLVMELLHGQSLRERAIDGEDRMPPRELLRVAHAVLDVLAAAHDAGVIHRDLKPDNIFLTRDGKVKLLDFGVARAVSTNDERTRAGQVVGTPEYMPPEQARGRSELIDGRSDLWSLGAVLFRILTGRPTRRAETANEMLLLAMTEPIPKVRSLLPNLDPKLADVVDVALSFDKEKRFADARTMQKAIEVVRDGIALDDARSTSPGFVADEAVTGVRPAGGPLWIHDQARASDPPVALKMKPRRGFWLLAALAFGVGVGLPIAMLKREHHTLRTELRLGSTGIATFVAPPPPPPPPPLPVASTVEPPFEELPDVPPKPTAGTSKAGKPPVATSSKKPTTTTKPVSSKTLPKKR
jgi:serine/threonine-protein kinase